MKFLFCIGLLAAFTLMLYGWGWAARRLLRAKPTNWAATAGSGLAAVVFLGGVLNLARLAYPWALLSIAGAGIAIGIVAIARGGWRIAPSQATLVALIPATAVLAFVVLTQVPPRAYNFHDDYQKYFAHTVRMLETGTVFGSEFSVIGMDTLGGQAFVHGFAAALFPIRYVNAMDAAFGLFLCMILAAQFARKKRDLLPMALLCSLSVMLINPQYVNISALYLGSFLIMSVIDEKGASPWITGLLGGSLIAMKSTLVLFPLTYLGGALFIRGFKWTANAVGALALFIAPWFLVHLPHYTALLTGGGTPSDYGVRGQDSFNVFSTHPLDFGSSPANYTWLIVAIALSGVMIAQARGKVDMTAAACFGSIVAYLAAVYISGPRAAGYDHAIRYFAPFLIGMAPAAFGSAAVAVSEMEGAPLMKMGLPLLISIVPVLAFMPSLRDRARQAIHSGSVLAFSWLAPDKEYLDYSRQVMDGDTRDRVCAAQAKIPASAEVVAWINAPFYLDFKRNRIVNVEPSEGFVTPWSKMPDANYFMWEYNSYANLDEADYADEMAEGPDLMRRAWAARSKMTREFTARRERGETLYDDGSIAVFRD